MSDRWVDVSAFQIPRRMRWREWRIPRGQYRLAIGRRLDLTGPEHRAYMRAAGMKTGSYGVPLEFPPMTDQAWKWVDSIPDDDENDDWVDAERAALTEPMLDQYCSEYDRRSRRQRLAIYTGFPWWISHVPPGRRARYAHYPLIIAGYPYDTPAGKPVPMDPVSVELRSTPPHDRQPAIPAPWTEYAGWQHTGQGSLPGYSGFLDMGIYRVNPAPPADELAGVYEALAQTRQARELLETL